VLRIEALLIRLVGVGRRQGCSFDADLSNLRTAPYIPVSWIAIGLAEGKGDTLAFADEGPLLAT
jgi:hypothetical protein